MAVNHGGVEPPRGLVVRHAESAFGAKPESPWLNKPGGVDIRRHGAWLCAYQHEIVRGATVPDACAAADAADGVVRPRMEREQYASREFARAAAARIRAGHHAA